LPMPFILAKGAVLAMDRKVSCRFGAYMADSGRNYQCETPARRAATWPHKVLSGILKPAHRAF
jgi:hypothetical protein